MYHIPDHPVIERLEREGMPEPEYDWLADYEIEEEPWEQEDKWWESESNV